MAESKAAAAAQSAAVGVVRDPVSRFGAAGKLEKGASAASTGPGKAETEVHHDPTGVGREREAVSRFGAGGRESAARERRLQSAQSAAAAAGGLAGKHRGRSYKKSDLGGTTAAGLQGLLEKGKSVEDVFKMLDVDDSGLLDKEELVQGMKALGTELSDNDIDELKGLLGMSQSVQGIEVNLDQFTKIVEQTPAASAGGTETGAWITQLNLYESFIPLIDEFEYLREADDDMSAQDKLAHVRGLQEADVRQIVQDASELLVGKLLEGIKALKDLFDKRLASSRDAQGGNSKFSGDAGGGQITMVYGKLDEFHEGLESMIGLPNPRIMEGMIIDHCERADSKDDFTAWNYGITTKPWIEWEYVFNPDPNKEYFGEATAENSHGRTRQTVAELMAKDKIVKAQLSKEELIALRLYTGPMFVKYNCILRGFPKGAIDGLKGNRYVTTLHAIVSGIRKLARVEPIPDGRCVYRGLGGMLLPSAFHDPDALGCMGGVERAFMSTTTKRAIAVQYSGNKTPTIFQISIGQIDMGASLNVLSQYAGEEEILMPPLSNLEVVGPKWYEQGCMVVPLRINVNLKSSTIDEIVMRRKILHKNMLANLISEAKRVVEQNSNSASLLHGSVAHRMVEQAGIFLGKGYEALQARHETISADAFNVDSLYKTLIVEGVEAKGQVLMMHRAVFYRISMLSQWDGDPQDTPLGMASVSLVSRGMPAGKAPTPAPGPTSMVTQPLHANAPSDKLANAPSDELANAPSDKLANAPSDELPVHKKPLEKRSKKAQLDNLLLAGMSPGKVASLVAASRLQLPVSCQACDPPKVEGAPLCVCRLFARIRILDLSNNGIGVEGAQILADTWLLPATPVPESLLLANNRLGSEGVRLLCMALQASLEGTGGQVVSVLKPNKFSLQSKGKLSKTPGSVVLDVVRVLHPEGAQLTRRETHSVCRATQLTLNAHAHVHSRMQTRTNIHVLRSLCQSVIGAKHLSPPAASRRVLDRRTVRLLLSYRPRADQRVPQAPQYTELCTLDLSKNSIGVEGVQHLAACLTAVTTLRDLNIACNDIKDYNTQPEESPIMQMVLALTQLSKLELSTNDVSYDMAEELMQLVSKKCQQIQLICGLPTMWAALRTERQRRERRDQLRRVVQESDSTAYSFRSSMRDASRCEFCGLTHDVHHGSFRFCFLPCFAEDPEDKEACAHCGGSRKEHMTSFLFCYGRQRREAVEELRKRNLMKSAVEEDVGKTMTPLMRASESGDELTLNLLLAAHAQLEKQDKSGRTALHYAAMAKDDACLRALLAAGSNVRHLSTQQRSALHLAILTNREHNAMQLMSVQGGCELVGLQDFEGKDCLHLAVEKEMEVFALDLLLHGGLALLESTTKDGRNALHIAAERGCAALCKRMLEIGGADVAQSKSANGKTCLHYCAEMSWQPRSKPADVAEAQRLLKRRDQMEAVARTMIDLLPVDSLACQDERKFTAFTYLTGSALEGCCLRMLERLQDVDIAGEDKPDDAGGEPQDEQQQQQQEQYSLLQRVVMLRAVDGCTALHWASAKGMLAVVQRLLAIGGKKLVCLRGVDGRTSLHWAASAGHEQVCSALIKVGKRELVLTAARDDWTALFWAASSGLHAASLEMIAEGRKDLLIISDRRGQTALHRAAWRGGEQMEEVCLKMIEVGGRELVDVVDGQARTVLHLAAYGGMSRLCNAAINTISVSKLVITDSDGKTALHIAVARGPCMDLELDGKASVCRKMIDNGGVELLMAKMLNGRTALHLAAERGMSGLCVFMVHNGGGRELLMEKDKNARTARNVIEGNLTDTAYLSQLSEELKDNVKETASKLKDLETEFPAFTQQR